MSLRGFVAFLRTSRIVCLSVLRVALAVVGGVVAAGTVVGLVAVGVVAVVSVNTLLALLSTTVGVYPAVRYDLRLLLQASRKLGVIVRLLGKVSVGILIRCTDIAKTLHSIGLTGYKVRSGLTVRAALLLSLGLSLFLVTTPVDRGRTRNGGLGRRRSFSFCLVVLRLCLLRCRCRGFVFHSGKVLGEDSCG